LNTHKGTNNQILPHLATGRSYNIGFMLGSASRMKPYLL